MKERGMQRGLVAGVAVLALLVAACSGGEVRPSGSPTPFVAETPEGQTPSTTLVQITAAPTVTDSPPPTPAPTTNAEFVNASAAKLLDDANRARCPTAVPGCNILSFAAEQPVTNSFDAGLAVFNVTSTEGVDRIMVLGKDPSGIWYLYQWGVQIYNPTALPSTVTICGFGEGAEVHQSSNASSNVVGDLDEGAAVEAQQFVLTQQGRLPTAQPLADPGYGWYHIAEPSGWVYSKYASATSDCTLHDETEPR